MSGSEGSGASTAKVFLFSPLAGTATVIGSLALKQATFACPEYGEGCPAHPTGPGAFVALTRHSFIAQVSARKVEATLRRRCR
ncbi:MAG: hypothetical protein ACP5UQ_09705 [Anaerolineae bacterium]